MALQVGLTISGRSCRSERTALHRLFLASQGLSFFVCLFFLWNAEIVVRVVVARAIITPPCGGATKLWGVFGGMNWDSEDRRGGTESLSEEDVVVPSSVRHVSPLLYHKW